MELLSSVYLGEEKIRNTKALKTDHIIAAIIVYYVLKIFSYIT